MVRRLFWATMLNNNLNLTCILHSLNFFRGMNSGRILTIIEG